jgi:5'-3' exonuclease, N-terminal resolvase-like domain
MERPKLETIFKLDRNPAPVVVVDFHVYLHDILRWFEEKVEGCYSREVEDKLLKGAWALKINRGPDMLPRHSYRFVVVADSRFADTSNYWRDRVMAESFEVRKAWVNYAEKEGKSLDELPTHYKGTRGEKTDNFWRVFNVGWEYVNNYFPVFSQEGYEADDIAGAIYRLSRDSETSSIVRKRQILLSTLDRDWSQLVDESHNVYFANTRVPFPREKIQERLVGNIGVIEHTKHRMGFDLDHPKNLSVWKVKHGDMGDNLPPGSPRCLFDLCEPHSLYCIEKAASWYPELKDCLENSEANDRSDHYEQSLRAFASIALEPPIRI